MSASSSSTASQFSAFYDTSEQVLQPHNSSKLKAHLSQLEDGEHQVEIVVKVGKAQTEAVKFSVTRTGDQLHFTGYIKDPNSKISATSVQNLQATMSSYKLTLKQLSHEAQPFMTLQFSPDAEESYTSLSNIQEGDDDNFVAEIPKFNVSPFDYVDDEEEGFSSLQIRNDVLLSMVNEVGAVSAEVQLQTGIPELLNLKQLSQHLINSKKPLFILDMDEVLLTLDTNNPCYNRVGPEDFKLVQGQSAQDIQNTLLELRANHPNAHIIVMTKSSQNAAEQKLAHVGIEKGWFNEVIGAQSGTEMHKGNRLQQYLDENNAEVFDTVVMVDDEMGNLNAVADVTKEQKLDYFPVLFTGAIEGVHLNRARVRWIKEHKKEKWINYDMDDYYRELPKDKMELNRVVQQRNEYLGIQPIDEEQKVNPDYDFKVYSKFENVRPNEALREVVKNGMKLKIADTTEDVSYPQHPTQADVLMAYLESRTGVHYEPDSPSYGIYNTEIFVNDNSTSSIETMSQPLGLTPPIFNAECRQLGIKAEDLNAQLKQEAAFQQFSGQFSEVKTIESTIMQLYWASLFEEEVIVTLSSDNFGKLNTCVNQYLQQFETELPTEEQKPLFDYVSKIAMYLALYRRARFLPQGYQ